MRMQCSLSSSTKFASLRVLPTTLTRHARVRVVKAINNESIRIFKGDVHMDVRFDGKIVVLFGGTAGIGEIIGKKFVKSGATVVYVGSRDASKLSDEFKKGYGDAEYYQLNIVQEDAVKVFAKYVEDKYGGADIIINNAGVITKGSPTECTLEDWNYVMTVNTTGPFLCCKYFLPQMIKKNKGAIVNITSVCGLAGDYGFFAYNASKGALVNMTRALALDYAKYNIRVNSVAPAQIRTGMFFNGDKRTGVDGFMDAAAKDAYPLGRAGEPEEVAAAVLFLASDYASFMTGHNMPVDGGVLAHNGNPFQPERILRDLQGARAK